MSAIGELLNNLFVDKIGLNENISELLIVVISVVLIILAGIILSKVLKVVIFKALRVDKNGARSLTVARLLSSISKYIVWFTVVLLVLEEVNINLTPFLASAGILGLAFGFGAQEIVKDFISGFFIIFEGTFVVGDVVQVDGFKGNVLSLGLRTTIIENWRGERKVINNGSIGSFINFSRNDSIAVIEFGVSYDTDLEKFKELIVPFLNEIEKKYDDVIETPAFTGITGLGSSSIDMRLTCKTNTMKHIQVERDVRTDLVVYLAKNNIEIPFPQVVIHNA